MKHRFKFIQAHATAFEEEDREYFTALLETQLQILREQNITLGRASQTLNEEMTRTGVQRCKPLEDNKAPTG